MIELTSGRYFGEVLQVADLDGLRLTETLHGPGITASRHSHESPYFCFVLAGGFAELADGSEREHATGDLIFHHASAPHANRFHATGARCLNVELGQRWALRAPLVPEAHGTHILQHGGAVGIGTRLYAEFRNPSAGAKLAVEGLVLLLLAELRRASAGREGPAPEIEDTLDRARAALTDRFREPWSLSGLAEELGTRPTRLARSFRRRYGCSVGQYVHLLRVREACRELTGTDRSLSSIAATTGFADQSHFTRIFKRHTGTTPGRYRERHGS